MQAGRSLWPGWSRGLQQWSLDRVAVVLLETAGPFTVLMAQLMYLGEPFLKGLLPLGQWNSLAALLEDEEESRMFAVYLREEKQ